MKARDIHPSVRQQGFTSLQLKNAARGALFVWPVRHSLGYVKALAAKLGRDDLKIVDPSALDNRGEKLRGNLFPAIILDHACEPSDDDLEALKLVEVYCVRG